MLASYHGIIGSLKRHGLVARSICLRLLIKHDTNEYADVIIALDSDELETLIQCVFCALHNQAKKTHPLNNHYSISGNPSLFFLPAAPRKANLQAQIHLTKLYQQLMAYGLIVAKRDSCLDAAQLVQVAAKPDKHITCDAVWLSSLIAEHADQLTITLQKGAQRLMSLCESTLEKEFSPIARTGKKPKPTPDITDNEDSDELCCPITLCPIEDPVSCTPTGTIFERKALLEHFRVNDRFDPCTRMPVAEIYDRPTPGKRIHTNNQSN